jgi:DNA polymerase-1
MKPKTNKSKKKVLALIDGNALVHRAYHALPPLTTKDGKPSGAVYGFALTLFGMMDQVKPDYIIAAFDVKGPTFRHKEFKEYKANRKKAPDDLYEQIPMCQDLLKAYGVPVYIKKGFEADDILGTISKKPEIEKTLDTLIVTGDMDLAQLVDEDTSIFTLRRGVKDTVIYDKEGVLEKYKIRPDQIVDYKALRGDPSDNIPGVKGVGDKTAVDLLQEFEHLDNIYKNLDKIEKPAVRKKLEDNEKEAFLSYSLATIATDVDVEIDLGEARVDKFSKDGLGKYLQEMGFQTLHKRVIGSGAGARGEVVPRGGANSDGRGGTSRSAELFTFTEIKTKKEITTLISKIKKKKQFSYILDVSGSKFYNAKISGAGINLGNNKVYYITSDYWPNLQELFSNPKIRKNGYDIKLDLELLTEKFTRQLGGQDFTVDDNFFDVKLAGYLLGQGKRSDLEKDVFTEFGESFQYDEKQGDQASLLSGLDENKKKLLAEKAGWITRLAGFYEDKFISKEKGLGKVFSELEMPLIAVLAKMEINGVKVDQKVLNDLSDFLGKKLATLEKKIYKLSGEKFNINSPGQLSEVLFEKMKLPTKGIKRGKTNYSTDAEQLEKLREIDPVIKFIEEYRTYAKLKNTYADPLPELVQEDERIHTSFNQTGAITGRLSSSEPNLQNIPKYGEVSKLIRQSFIADERKVLVSADYSQIDLRVAAHLSQDPKMMQIFNDGKDIHKSTAAWVNGIELDEVAKEQRSEAKSLNFGVLYGMGTYGFMRDSGVSKERAEFFIAQYMKTFSKLKEFIEKTKEDARKNGFVETEFGRRRYLPNINASNYMVRGGAERAAINFPIQGLAADIMKLAMLRVHTLVEDQKSSHFAKATKDKKVESKGLDMPKLELQIHDELIIEIDKDKAGNFSQELKKTMENVYKLKVPLTVETSTGKNWGEL